MRGTEKRIRLAVLSVLVLSPAILGLPSLLGGCRTAYDWRSYPDRSSLNELSAAEWREDVEHLRSELPERNPHFDDDSDMAQRFDNAATALVQAITEDDSPEWIVAEIAKLLALVGEGHTRLNTGPERYFPLIAAWFSDGVYVAGADREYQREYPDLIGARITGIQRPDDTFLEIAQLEDVLEEVIPVDHPNGYQPAYGTVLLDPYLTRGLGLADEDGLRYRVDTGGSSEETVTIQEKAAEELSIVRAKDDAPRRPLRDTSTQENWYTRFGPDQRSLYVYYSVCRTRAAGFFQGILTEAKRSPVDRVVIDLRDNSGGISLPGTWFAGQLAGIPELNRTGGIFVLIGPRTFSSGTMMAVDLMDKTEALFAGQELSQKPSHYGEVERFPLPNSGLMIGHSTRRISYGEGKELRLSSEGLIQPDPGLEARRSFQDYRSGIDPAMEAVRAYE